VLCGSGFLYCAFVDGRADAFERRQNLAFFALGLAFVLTVGRSADRPWSIGPGPLRFCARLALLGIAIAGIAHLHIEGTKSEAFGPSLLLGILGVLAALRPRLI
jgi:hypothetical protein